MILGLTQEQIDLILLGTTYRVCERCMVYWEQADKSLGRCWNCFKKDMVKLAAPKWGNMFRSEYAMDDSGYFFRSLSSERSERDSDCNSPD